MNNKIKDFCGIGLFWAFSLCAFQFLSFLLVFLFIGPAVIFFGPIVDHGLNHLALLEVISAKIFLVFLVIFLIFVSLLRHKKFTPSIILSFLFPILSPLVFVWLEIYLFRQKKWLWFWYVMSVYFVLVISGYEHFRNLVQQ